MKLKLHWTERYETVREFPPFELDSEQFPELEMQMLAVHNAGSLGQQQEALQQLEYGMNNVVTERGETIMQMVGPWKEVEKSSTYQSVADEGFLKLVGDE